MKDSLILIFFFSANEEKQFKENVEIDIFYQKHIGRKKLLNERLSVEISS